MAAVVRPGFGDGERRSEISKLIDAARNGGQDALGRLLKVSYVYCRLHAVEEMPRSLASKFDVSDILQNCAEDVFRSFVSFRGRSGEFYGWLRRIVRNNTIDLQRKHGRAAGKEAAIDADLHRVAAPSSPDPLVVNELKSRVQDALSLLSADHETVLRLRIWGNLEWNEIGVEMGRSGDAARKLFVRATEEVRVVLGNDGAGSVSAT